MKFNTTLYPFLFALIAAIGNAFFAYGQKKSTAISAPFLFLIPTLVVCLILLTFSIFFYKPETLKEYLAQNWIYFVISGVGLYFTFVGFYLLYSRFGASYYILYAVLSILTTSIFVGVIVFSEKINLFHYLSILSALISIFLFHYGQNATK
ncbi:transporter [Leptospira stimsonii]|uniref:Transporter n=1 Tax=Leptospira stimsonii TaxID=2202203 RepID=A0ABY2NCT4_9LEPT|nr:transporter [Leptospira stimsonii]TGK20411.1 transporter [Leptospira stimsonii]TGM21522.1 transporter [Leptospira stimsonii]